MAGSNLSIHLRLVLDASTEGPTVSGVGSPQQAINLSTTLLSFSRMQDARDSKLGSGTRWS
jgi:hypothetical protein